MEVLLLAFIAFLILLGWVFLGKNRDGSARSASITYTKKHALLSPAERSFYGVLQQAVGNTYHIHAKVRLADLIQPASSLSRSDWRTALNRIDRKHLDFVLVDPSTTEVMYAIELDDSSHSSDKRVQRDTFVNAALESAGLRLIRVPAKSAYSLSEVRSMLGFEANPQSSGTTAPATPTCPKCAAPMVKRQASRGEHAGKLFWACSRYPECRSIVSINN
ncbi:MAG: hypothetical protein KatS3mg070_2866 [Meiothermus sp.]|uniref:DUF2726 domain-containing protein n=1 Tax=Meiothermus sp. TaxID=1955249 RepID=UPI0021DC6E08|nr:DUF2726 domain-containing protein [Meiothermus sp.]GIW29503.1 MAG: hypothetical protein KatS3mg070_2866 [Meiothermus sp.]